MIEQDLDFKQKSIDLIQRLKSERYGDFSIPLLALPGFVLRPATFDMVTDSAIKILAQWRMENMSGYTKVFQVTLEGTRKWLELGVLKRPDRIMFMVEDAEGRSVGHLGLSSFDFAARTFEIDNIVKGDKQAPAGLFFHACDSLIQWASHKLSPVAVKLRVLNENSRALALYHRLQFQPESLIPLKKIVTEDATEWVECTSPQDPIDRFFILMSKKIHDN